MDLLRQQDLIDGRVIRDTKILLIGAGGIGSFAGYALAKMGITSMQVWDNDKVEEHNIPNQNFLLSDIGQYKTLALKNLISKMTGTSVETKETFFVGDLSYQPDIIVSAVDSQNIRRELWQAMEAQVPMPTWLLDARMSSMSMSLYVAKLDNIPSIEAYKDNALFPADEAMVEPCTAKAIIHTCMACSYMISNAVFHILTDKVVHPSYHGNLKDYYLTKEKKIIS